MGGTRTAWRIASSKDIAEEKLLASARELEAAIAQDNTVSRA